MGKIKQGILGGFSGAVGPIVGSSWKGIDYMKSKPTSVANPRTAPQVAQRTKFGNTVAFAKEILAAVIKPLNDRFAVKMSGFNVFVQNNIDLFVAAMPAPAADLVIASGKMEKTDITVLSALAGAGEVTLEWLDDSGIGYKLAGDKAYAVAVNETKGTVSSNGGGALRSAVEISVDFDNSVEAGDILNIYLVFLRDDGTVVSNTAFKTMTVA